MSKKYLGLDFFKGSKTEFINLLFGVFDKSLQGEPKIVVTPNPEMIVAMKKNPDFATVLRGADYRLIDGVGLFLALKVWGLRPVSRITGSDLFLEVLNLNSGLDESKKLKIFLLGAGVGVADKIASKYPNALIVGTYSPKFSLNQLEGELICQKIINAKADLVFVAFGAPKQELWMWKFKSNLVGVRYLLGVGGAFDFVAGEVERSPEWMRKFGLEWLYRLKKQPLKRLFRICIAVIVFPIVFAGDLILRWKSKK